MRAARAVLSAEKQQRQQLLLNACSLVSPTRLLPPARAPPQASAALASSAMLLRGDKPRVAADWLAKAVRLHQFAVDVPGGYAGSNPDYVPLATEGFLYPSYDQSE